ncbi:hypothetical protein [Spirilliplanes yamanashiensis]|uniref:O-antigen ligase n=1 Tax=Spirilliplanes yamanashiensis TaxID=42233 RepID=A0A8J3YAH1_9ACTN|nr:hypothetical protein [Spirilliplanes yamanashiensis]MDP9818098.1 hypothetical protein [Spirilliplanes yamanashiensis]GIJ04908.1 hypothetical protein Sya03_42600 [Spirilliplanes yamanashiensis]
MTTAPPVVVEPAAAGPAPRPAVAQASVPATAGRGPIALLLLAVALAAAVPVLPGKLLLLDVAVLLALPLIASTLVTDRRFGWPVLVIGAWGLGLLFADLAAGNGPRVGQHMVAAFGILTLSAALVRLSRNDPERLRLLIAALAVGVAVGGLSTGEAGPTSYLYPNGPPATPAILWKYKLAEPISIAVLALCDIRWRAGSRTPTFAALILLTAADIVCDLRSLAVATLCALALAAIAATKRVRLRPATIIALGGIPCLLLVGGFFAAAKAGWLGERSVEQFRGGAQVDFWTIMANGRPEGLQALYLISEKPYGWGSQPGIDSVTFAESLTFINEHNVTVDVNLPKDWIVKTDPGLAAHSQALDTVVQAGLLAVPFWIFLLAVGLRRAMTAIRLRAGPLIAFWTVATGWNLLFEPLVWPNHLLMAGYLAVVLLPLPGQAELRPEEAR